MGGIGSGSWKRIVRKTTVEDHFHSLRGTSATNLAKAGVSPKAAQELMRHSDINLTMKVYTNLRLSDVTSDLEKLPSFPIDQPKKLRATGTTDYQASDNAAISKKTSRSVARLVSRAIDDSCENLNSIEETETSQNDAEVPITANEKVPENQGLKDGCGQVTAAENQKPPDRFELSTYALRKHRSAN